MGSSSFLNAMYVANVSTLVMFLLMKHHCMKKEYEGWDGNHWLTCLCAFRVFAICLTLFLFWIFFRTLNNYIRFALFDLIMSSNIVVLLMYKLYEKNAFKDQHWAVELMIGGGVFGFSAFAIGLLFGLLFDMTTGDDERKKDDDYGEFDESMLDELDKELEGFGPGGGRKWDDFLDDEEEEQGSMGNATGNGEGDENKNGHGLYGSQSSKDEAKLLDNMY